MVSVASREARNPTHDVAEKTTSMIFGRRSKTKRDYLLVPPSLQLPIKLLVPARGPLCPAAGFRVLGLGDIAAPGVIVALAVRFDDWLLSNNSTLQHTPKNALRRRALVLGSDDDDDLDDDLDDLDVVVDDDMEEEDDDDDSLTDRGVVGGAAGGSSYTEGAGKKLGAAAGGRREDDVELGTTRRVVVAKTRRGGHHACAARRRVAVPSSLRVHHRDAADDGFALETNDDARDDSSRDKTATRACAQAANAATGDCRHRRRRRLDKEPATRAPSYGAAAAAGYAVGLCAAIVAADRFDAAQPALLYIVPAVVAPVLALAWTRRSAGASGHDNHLRLLWHGFDDDDDDDIDDVDNRRGGGDSSSAEFLLASGGA